MHGVQVGQVPRQAERHEGSGKNGDRDPQAVISDNFRTELTAQEQDDRELDDPPEPSHDDGERIRQTPALQSPLSGSSEGQLSARFGSRRCSGSGDTFPGVPTTSELAGTSLVTTAPAATNTRLPSVVWVGM